jgi:hypothetical protein
MGGRIGGMQRKLPSPTKPSRQKHLFVLGSQAAFRPHDDESQRSRHLPDTQESGSGQGLAAEQTSGAQLPPGNGLPVVPLVQAHAGPDDAMMHCAFRPQMTLSHMEVHLPASFS